MLYIAVNYRTTLQATDYAACFDTSSVERSAVRAYVVDNSDGNLSGALENNLTQLGSSVRCINSGSNLGYLGGARLGLEIAAPEDWSPDWIVVSNVDLKFDPNSIAKELASIDCSGVGVIAPRIISTRFGRELNPFMRRRPSSVRMHFYKWIFRRYYLASAYGWASEALIRIKKSRVSIDSIASDPKRDTTAPIPIYAPHGSFMIFSREYFGRGGTLEHAPFLFGEEITIAERARVLGLQVIFCPAIAVRHVEHASIALLPSRRAHRYIADAAAHSADRYF